MARSPTGPNGAWKKSVPTISADGISSSLRPLLGYTLWRLYERETYSFVKDASILVTDDENVSLAARKVGINVQTFKALLGHASAHSPSKSGSGLWGDVERDFGVAPPSKTASVNGHEKLSQASLQEDKASEGQNEQPEGVENQKQALPLEKDERETEEVHIQNINGTQNGPAAVNDIPLEGVVPTEDLFRNARKAASKDNSDGAADIEEAGQSCLQGAQPDAVPPRRAWADVVSNRLRPIEERYPPPVINAPAPLDQSEDNIDAPPTLPLDRVDEEKANTIADWVRSVKANMDEDVKTSPNRPNRKRSPRNKKSEKPSPPQEPPAKPFRPILMQRTPKSSQATSDKAPNGLHEGQTSSPPPSLQPITQDQHEKDIQSIEEIGIVQESLGNATPKATDIVQSTDENLLSRSAEAAQISSQHRSTDSTASSAHTMASRDTSLAKSAPIEEPMDSEEEVVVFNPRAKRLSAQQQSQKPAFEEPPVLKEQANGVKPGHTKHLSVEEPKTLPRQTPEKAVPMMVPAKQQRHPKPKAAPIVIDPDAFGRDFASNPQATHHNGYHRPHSRPTSQHGPPRPIPHSGVPRGGGGGRGGRPFIHPQALPPMQNGQHVHPNGNNRGGRQNRMPSVNGPKAQAAVNQGSAAVNGQIAAQPSLRLSPRVEPQPMAQTNLPEPEVDFVLQSGPPRGSTRGRGKLWIP